MLQQPTFYWRATYSLDVSMRKIGLRSGTVIFLFSVLSLLQNLSNGCPPGLYARVFEGIQHLIDGLLFRTRIRVQKHLYIMFHTAVRCVRFVMVLSNCLVSAFSASSGKQMNPGRTAFAQISANLGQYPLPDIAFR